jgi:hypothetical protein
LKMICATGLPVPEASVVVGSPAQKERVMLSSRPTIPEIKLLA